MAKGIPERPEYLELFFGNKIFKVKDLQELLDIVQNKIAPLKRNNLDETGFSKNKKKIEFDKNGVTCLLSIIRAPVQFNILTQQNSLVTLDGHAISKGEKDSIYVKILLSKADTGTS